MRTQALASRSGPSTRSSERWAPAAQALAICEPHPLGVGNADHLTALGSPESSTLAVLLGVERALTDAGLGELARSLTLGNEARQSALVAAEELGAAPTEVSRHALGAALGSPEHVLALLARSTGAPLPPAVAARVEAALGVDASRIRIHTGAAAAQAAREVSALAFALGDDIVFGQGAYRPGTPDGDHLLIHEATHVLQHQEGRIPRTSDDGLSVSKPSDPHEREAEATADAVGSLDSVALDDPGQDLALDRGALAHGPAAGVETGVDVGAESGAMISRFEAGIHQSAELDVLVRAGMSPEEAMEVYFGNWLRDFNQLMAPVILEHLEPPVVLAVVNVLTTQKFGRTVTAEQLGAYVPAEHMDNPAGLLPEDLPNPRWWEDPDHPEWRSYGPDAASATPAQHRTPQSSVDPVTGSVLGANLFSADQDGVMAFIRRTNLHVESRLSLAATCGPTQDGRMHFGAALHAVEDLFAHSNWVEIALGDLLADNPSLLPTLQGEDRQPYTFSPRVGPDQRPVLTTGSFTGADSAISLASEVVTFLRKPPAHPASPDEQNAEAKFTLELLRSLTKRLDTDAEFRAGVRNAIVRAMPGWVPDVTADALLLVPLDDLYFLSTKVALPPEVKDAIGLTALQQAIRQLIYTHVMLPAADQIEGAGVEAAVADTSLLVVLDQQQQQADAPITGDTTAERAASTEQQDEAKRRATALESTPQPVLAGPSHSQIAKDHPNSPMFGLAFFMAEQAIAMLYEKMSAAWSDQPATSAGAAAGARAGQNAVSPPPPGLAEDAQQSAARGDAIRTQGKDPSMPTEAYNLARQRKIAADTVRAVAGALDAIASAPAEAEAILEAAKRKLGAVPSSLTAAMSNFLGGAASAVHRGGVALEDVLELGFAASLLGEVAALLEIATTLDEREMAADHFETTLWDVATCLADAPSVSLAVRATLLAALYRELQSARPSYSTAQRDALAGSAQVPGVTQKTLPRSQITLPDLSALPPKQKVLLETSRLIIDHPFDARWWRPAMLSYVTAHGPQIAAEIQARNAGYALMRRDPGDTH